jgi:hypothetical protein
VDIVSHLGSFRCSSFPCPRLAGPAPSRPLAIFYRFTVEEPIENGDRACATLDRTARGEVSGVDVSLRADHVVAVPTIGSCATRSPANSAASPMGLAGEVEVLDTLYERVCTRAGRTGTSPPSSPGQPEAKRLGAHWVPNPGDLAVKPGGIATEARPENPRVCRDIRREREPCALLAMQKVEGSNPFSRFRKAWIAGLFRWAQSAGAFASPGTQWAPGGQCAAGASQNKPVAGIS